MAQYSFTSYYQEQKILYATEVTEGIERSLNCKTESKLLVFLRDLCVLCGKACNLYSDESIMTTTLPSRYENKLASKELFIFYERALPGALCDSVM